jgi:hypothetical protein
VVVTADWPAAALLTEVEQLIEASIPVLERGVGRLLPEGEQLVFHLYREPSDMYDAARAVEATPESELALTAISTGDSFVVMQPSSDPTYLAAVGGVPEALEAQVLHEAVHQFVYRSHPLSEAFLPGWFIEGRAEYLGQKVLLELGREPERSVWISSTANLVAQAVAQGEHIPFERLLAATYDTDKDQLFYRQSTSLFAFLSEDEGPAGERFSRYLEWIDAEHAVDSKNLRPRVDFERQVTKATASFRARCGPADVLERDWRRRAAVGPGDWQNVWTGCQWVGDQLIATTNLDWSQSLLLHSRVPARDSYSISAEVQVTEGTGSVFLGFEAGPQLFARVDVHADWIAVVSFLPSSWTTLAKRRVDAARDDPWRELEIGVTGQDVRVACAGAVLQVTLPERLDLANEPWGVGALAGGFARFRSIRIE